MRGWVLVFSLLPLALGARGATAAKPAAGDLAVSIEIVADSSNILHAQVLVPAGANGREVMNKLFQMEYLDAGKKFVVGIAGFTALPREKKFWKLEVEGAASQVGIAEVVITRATRLRWVITPY